MSKKAIINAFRLPSGLKNTITIWGVGRSTGKRLIGDKVNGLTPSVTFELDQQELGKFIRDLSMEYKSIFGDDLEKGDIENGK